MQTLDQREENNQASMHNTDRPLKRTGTPFEPDDIRSSKRTRGRTGCLNCRRRRKKCDEVKPCCSKCQSRGEQCEWDTGITFRLSGLDSQHPSMLQAKKPKSVVNQNGLRIVDVHFNNKIISPRSDKAGSTSVNRPSTQADGSSRSTVSNGDRIDRADGSRCSTGIFCEDANDNGTLSTILEEPSSTCADPEADHESSSLPKCQKFPMEQANPADVVSETDNGAAIIETVFDGDEEMHGYVRSNSDASASVPSFPWSTAISTSSVTSVSSGASKHDQTKQTTVVDGLTHLETLNWLMHDPSHAALQDPSPQGVGATSALEKVRQKLHLQHKASPVHRPLSDHDGEASATAMRDLRLSGESKVRGIRLVHTPLVARPIGCTKLVKRDQLELWRHYIDDIAPCLDVCSSKRHFQHTLPMLAKSDSHLHYAVLALSARHLEQQEPTSTLSESQGLQQDAINLLLPKLPTLDNATIATCVILCIIDLLSSPASQCDHSLSTCAALMQTADINACSGGFRQAQFWCFANFAVWYSLSHPERATVLPMQAFYPSESFAATVNYVRSLTLGDGYAKYAVFLATTIINFQSHLRSDSNPNQAPTQAQHSALTDLLSDWSNCRPEDMQPLMSYPSILDDEHHPFPMVLYATVPATIANLLYHCASILLLQHPSDNSSIEPTGNECSDSNDASLAKKSNSTVNSSPARTTTGKGIVWHARQICGVLSECHDPAVLIHGRHALDIAAKVISHGSEKEAILGLLGMIERRTGWKTVR